MQKCLILLLVGSMQLIVNAQSNLVLNPSFENYIDTESFGFVGYGAFRDHLVVDWSDPNHSTTDLYTFKGYGHLSTYPYIEGILGFQYPRSGSAFGGGHIYSRTSGSFREFMQGSFRDSLQLGKIYGIKYYLALNDYSSCVSDFGFYFSDTLIDTYEYEHFSKPFLNPQYENPSSNIITEFDGWQEMKGNYTAHGGEKYFSVGNFTQDSLVISTLCTINAIDAAYYYIDDVGIYDPSIIDTIKLCGNDSTEIGGIWYKPSAAIISETIGSVVIRHYIEQRPNSISYTEINVPYTRGDTVQVGALWVCYSDSVKRPFFFCDSLDSIGSCYHTIFLWATHDTFVDAYYQNIYGCDSTVRYRCGTNIGFANELTNQLQWNIYPNPANDFIQVRLSSNDPSKYAVMIIDVAGREVLTHSLVNEKIDISALKSGMYFIKLINTKTGVVVGTEKFVKE